MFHVLLESAARTPRRAGWTFGSAAMHAGVITAALALTAVSDPSLPPKSLQDPIFYLRPPTLTPRPATLEGQGSSTSVTPDLPVVILPDAPSVGIPSEKEFSLDYPLDTLGRGILRDAFLRHGPGLGAGVYSENLVERAVIPRAGNRSPEYPQSLRASMVEGEVLLQFVVDTTGRVEQQSISILRSSHALFEESARRWLSRTRYVPAQLGGQAVRQLVQQRIAFTLDR